MDTTEIAVVTIAAGLIVLVLWYFFSGLSGNFGKSRQTAKNLQREERKGREGIEH